MGYARHNLECCGHFEKDKLTQANMIQTLADSLKGSKLKYFFEVHKGAEHGYALPDRDVHDKHASNPDWEVILGMFRRQLKPYQM
ncbi:MAG: dienelactone hydrolase family protein [Burkholderiales bacterium]